MTKPLAARALALVILVFAWACSGDKTEINPLEGAISKASGKDKKKSRSTNERDAALSEETEDAPEKALAVFRKHCVECHGATGGQGELGDVTNLVGLVSNEQVKPGYPKKSPLFQRIKAKEMPPDGKKALSDAEVATIEDWIKRGALSADLETERGFVKENEMYDAVARDMLGRYSEDERKNIRYFTLTHLYNGGVAREVIDTAGEGLGKLMNSLSWEEEPKPVVAVDSDRTIFRVDLRDYGWTALQWEDLVRSYSYLVVPKDGKSLSVLQSDTKASVPVLRGDWFLANASRAPLYYKLLKVPDKLSELEAKLKVDTAANIKAKNVARAGFDDSGVSKMHRVLERHELTDGFLWRSYEFGSKEKQQDVFKFPLGPLTGTKRTAAAPTNPNPFVFGPQPLPTSTAPLGAAAQAFTEDGGEFMFTLPNKMLAFYLAAKDDGRLDKVPTDPGDPEIIAGMSCMNCHAGGPIVKTDKVRDKADSFPSTVSSIIEAIYKPADEFRKIVTDDDQTFQAALKKAGVDFAKRKKDPVSRIAEGFPLDLSMAQAAAELGVDKRTLQKALEDDSLSEAAGKFSDNSIARDDFKAVFQQLAEALKDSI